MNPDRFRDLCDAVARKMLDEGKLMAAGWYVFRTHFMPRDAKAAEIEATRIAFYAGAQHLFHSLTGQNVMDPCEEPTDADLRRMDRLNDELTAFAAEMQTTKGHA